jgi:hypothetical protein
VISPEGCRDRRWWVGFLELGGKGEPTLPGAAAVDAALVFVVLRDGRE